MTRPNPIPDVAFSNLFRADPLGEPYWAWRLGGAWPELREHFERLGRLGAAATPLSARADRESPRLETHDPRGERIDRVAYHPDYRALEAMAYGEGGIVALKYEPALLERHRGLRHQVGFGAGFYFAQTETGLYCPICMTDGVARVLERHPVRGPGGEALTRRVLERLTTRDREALWQGAMFLTEPQGGSDVGANTVEARREDGRWRLYGDKWFCSNVDAEAVLALARLPDGPAGTRGLGLFLVLREEPAGNAATVRVHRLKDKLGVRSMPTGEVTLEGSEGFLVGAEGEGFKFMAEMLNLSRLYNAVASIALLRRALLEAAAYGQRREAFGRRLSELPLWRANVADLMAETWGAQHAVFAAAAALDKADTGDAPAAAEVRLLTPMVKAVTGKLALFGISEAMEAIGGNAYIEESIVPRLLRDAQVLPIWEGTTNILALDGLRAIEKERGHEGYFQRVDETLARARDHADPAWIRQVADRRDDEAGRLEALAGQPPEQQQRAARAWLDSAFRTLELALLLESMAHEPLREVGAAAFRRLAARPGVTAPLSGPETPALADTEAPLLAAAWRPETA